MIRTLSLWLLLVGLNGCIIPLGHKTTLGHKPAQEALAFLDLPVTSRDDVLSSLGQPFWESAELRIMLYVWETSLEWYVHPPKPFEPGKENSHTKRWGLFISYSERGIVSAHEVRGIDALSPEKACVEWLSRRTGNQ